MHLQENQKKTLNRIEKSLNRVLKKIKRDEKEDSKWTPAIARAYGIRIDSKIKSSGRSGLQAQSIDDKLDSIIKMCM